MESKKLYRSEEKRMIAGVCGGLERYLGIDATVIRILWALWGLTGIGIVVYILAAIIIPQEESYN